MTAVRRILDPLPRPEDTFLKLSAAAKLLNVNTLTMRRMIAAGQIVGFRLPGGDIRLRHADVLALLTPIPAAWNAYLADAPAVTEIAREKVDEIVVIEPRPDAETVAPVPEGMVVVDPRTVLPPSEQAVRDAAAAAALEPQKGAYSAYEDAVAANLAAALDADE